MPVSPVRFGTVFVAPRTAASALNEITHNPQFKEQNPAATSVMGRQFLASLTGVMRICEGGAVYFKPADLTGGMQDVFARQYLQNHGVSQNDLLVVTGASVGDILPNETPERFVLKQLMFKPQDVRWISEQQVELALDSITRFYQGKIPMTLMSNLHQYHRAAHNAEFSDPKRPIANPAFLVNWWPQGVGQALPTTTVPGVQHPIALTQKPITLSAAAMAFAGSPQQASDKQRLNQLA